jgi:hypothetical protein
MNETLGRELLELAGGRKITKAGHYLKCCCPFGPLFHSNGVDRNPSFFLYLGSDEKPAFFNCFGCGQGGSLLKFVHLMNVMSGYFRTDLTKYVIAEDAIEQEIITRIEGLTGFDPFISKPEEEFVIPEFVEFSYAKERFEACGFEAYENCTNTIAIKWLEGRRKIPKHILIDGLVYVGVDAILFPVCDSSMRMYELYARKLGDKDFRRVRPEVLGFEQNYRSNSHFYLEHLCSDTVTTGVIVEGAFDAFRLLELGMTGVLASLGSIAKDQLTSLWFDTVLLGFDADKGGQRMLKKSFELLKGKTALGVLRWDVIGSDEKRCKDADDIRTRAQLKTVLSHIKLYRPRLNFSL